MKMIFVFLYSMPRHQTHSVRQYFVYDKLENRSNCLVDKCLATVKGNHAGNLMRHLRKHHRRKFDELLQQENKQIYLTTPSTIRPSTSDYYAEKKKINLPLYAENIKKGCVEMIVINCRPLSIFTDSGFRKIIQPILDASNATFVINEDSIKNFIFQQSEAVRDKIRCCIRGKIISIKLDSMTRSKRTIIAVNIQYIDCSKICVHTLSTFELDESHNSEYLCSKIIEVLNIYGIHLEQIHAITCDNGLNVSKCFLENLESDDLYLSDTENESDTHEDEKKINDILEETICALRTNLDNQLMYLNLFTVNLMTNQFYSSIIESLKNSEIQTIVTFVKKIRTPVVLDYLKESNIQFPFVDFKLSENEPSFDIKITSIYHMLNVLLSLKNFLNHQQKISEINSQANYFFFHPTYWKKAEEMKLGLETVILTMKIFQSRLLTISDFYGEWLRCKLNVSKLCSDFSQILYDQLTKYENDLLINTYVSSAIYLDPRFQSTLPIERRQEAKWHLKNVWDCFSKVISNNAKKYVNSTTEDEFEKHLLDISIVKVENNMNPEVDEFDNYLKNISVDNIEHNDIKANIENIIEEFDNYPRLQYKASILQFWEEHRQSKPELYNISKIVLGVPATQATIERCFTTFKYIMSIEESMDEHTLENIFLIRLDHQESHQ